MKHLILFPVLLLCSLVTLRADVKLPAIFGDHMVLQREAKLPVWGWADPGEKVKVTIDHQSAETIAGEDGKWRIDIDPLPTTTKPVTLVVAGKNTLKFEDVLIGDVWLCSGQSNMVYGLRHSHGGREEVTQANYPQIRLFFVTKSGRDVPSDSFAEAPFDSPLQGKWQVCTPETIWKIGDFTDQDEGGFSAVGYFFAKTIHLSTKQPVGIIGSYVGGTDAEAWTSLAGLKKEPSLAAYAAKLNSPTEVQKLFYSLKWADYVAAYQKWRGEFGKAYNEALTQWSISAKKAEALGNPAPPRPEPPEPRPRNPNSIPAPPASLFNGMISPLIPYSIKGVVWYQGENNVGKGNDYGILLSALIRDWREQWGQGSLPFLFVQLPNCFPPPRTAGDFSAWAILRESQLKTLVLPHTGMAVAIDIGTVGIHPPNKADVGARLALAARHVAYGEDLVYTGPVYDSMKVEGNKIQIAFQPNSIGGGLVIGSAPWTDPKAEPVSKTELQGFAIAGEDKKWVWAEAKINGDNVVVSSPEVPQPIAVRYAWADNPPCNLYNKEGLPASPFRTDEWNMNLKSPAN